MSEKKKVAHAAPQQLQVKIELDPETAQGIYANMAMVNHNENEFTLDFIYVQPQEPKGKVRARIISSPRHAKRLLIALQEGIKGYEQKFGAIEIGPNMPMPSGKILN